MLHNFSPVPLFVCVGQDPKYPVENLVLEEGCRPWLCCPHDRSRQLKVELQLEQASHVGYVDVGEQVGGQGVQVFRLS